MSLLTFGLGQDESTLLVLGLGEAGLVNLPLVVTEGALVGLEKGAAGMVVFTMVSSVDTKTPQLGKSVTVSVSKDGGSFVASTNTVVEIGSGAYYILLTATEKDADVIALLADASGCSCRIITIYTDAITPDVQRVVKNKLTIDESGSKLQLWDDAGSAVLYEWVLTDKDDASISLTAGPPANRGVPT